jgi:chromosome segregation protein
VAYLKRLDLHGFKSFPARTAFEFGPGITAIIGPNGSGKSNVADAIRWVLGEQSARAMRLRRLDDALFSGGRRRPPAGFADVSIWLDNADGRLPIAFAEVVVGRRLHRSGEVEYLLNRRRVRLRDVHELFGSAGLGPNSYALMGQGLVDQLLSLRPDERRALIEEAADVTRFRLRAEEAQARLAATRDNLARLTLLVEEIAPRLAQLERQARHARVHADLARRLAEALHAWYGHRWRTAEHALAGARAGYAEQGAAFVAARAELDRLEARLADVRGRLEAERAARREAEERARRHAEDGRAAAQRLRLEEERLVFVRRRLDELDAELRALAEERATLLDPDADPPPDASPPTADPEAARAALAARQAELRDGESARDAARRAELSSADALRRARDALEEAEERLVRADRAAEALRGQAAALAQRQGAQLVRLAAIGRGVLARRRELEAADAAAAAADRAHEHARRSLEDVQAQAAGIEAEAAALRDTLAEQLRHRERLGRALAGRSAPDVPARAVAAHGGGPAGEGVRGLLGELLRVPRGMEAAIEAALGDYLDAAVVPARAEALEALATLHERGAGRVTAIPLDALRPSPPLVLRPERGVVGVASRFVRCDPALRPVVDTLLGRFIIVEDVAAGLVMLERGLGTPVTLAGTVLRPNGTLTGGRDGDESSRLALARALEDTAAAVARTRAALADAERAREAIRPRLGRARVAAEQAGAAAERARREAARARDRLAAERAALAPVGGELRELRRTAAGVQERLARLAAERGELLADVERLRARRAAAAAAADAARRAVQEADAHCVALARSVAEARAAITALEQEQAALAALRERRRAALARLEERVTARTREAEGRRREIARVEDDCASLRRAIASAAAEGAAAEAAAAPARRRAAALAQEVEELESLAAARRRALADIERACLRAEAELQQRAQALERLREEMDAEGIAPLPSAAGGEQERDEVPAGHARKRHPGAGTDAPHEPLPSTVADAGAADDPDDLHARVRTLRARIRALGPVNARAEADYEADRGRHDYLTAQIADLRAAEAGLQGALDDLRRQMRTRFQEALVQVNADFQEYFHAFFGGGTAQLVPADDADGGEAGIDIIARPPGKRLQSLALLSGGERAMTAVALLFALLQRNPAPFCVLDEVDAALDESNVGRFVEALRGLARRTQFIVITHNRVTIEAADTVYGVTMDAEGVSTVLGLRLPTGE